MSSEIVDLLDNGHIKLISPRQVLSWDNIPAACRRMRGSKHIGKLIVSNGPDTKVEVQVCTFHAIIFQEHWQLCEFAINVHRYVVFNEA